MQRRAESRGRITAELDERVVEQHQKASGGERACTKWSGRQGLDADICPLPQTGQSRKDLPVSLR